MSAPPPDTIAELLQAGMRHLEARRPQEAERAYREALRHDADHPEALHRMGILKAITGRLPAAIAFFQQALRRDPRNPQLLQNLGVTYGRLGDLERALAALKQAIECDPSLLDAYRNAAEMAKAGAAQADAARDSQTANELRAIAAAYLCGLGQQKYHRHAFSDAVATYREAVALSPRDGNIHGALGLMLMDQGLPSAAEPVLRRAIELAPNLGSTYVNLARTLFDLGRPDDAEAAATTALKLDPALGAGAGLLLYLHYRADRSAEQVFAAHRNWGATAVARRAPKSAPPPFSNSRDPDRRLRVGYVSPDLRRHPVAYFLEALLRRHDQTAVDSFCYAEVHVDDDVTRRLQGWAQHWRCTVGMSDEALYQQIREDGIDILVDLAGHTAGNRLSTFAAKPVPIAVSWLGYPGSSGLPTIDYRLSDALADPSEADALHTEQLVRLPHGFLCYQPSADAPPISPLPGLNGHGATFGSFNNFAKVTPDVVRLWARILRALPDARLVLKSYILGDPVVRQGCLGRFAAEGVAAQRVVPRPMTDSVVEHLASYGAIDIALDPFPYNGTTTTCEALWMGVPVVTLVGDRHAGRVGLSLLSRVGLGHLAAADPDTYVHTAVALASDLDALAALRAGLREQMRQSPLCDATGFARSVEAAFREMWRRWCSGAA